MVAPLAGPEAGAPFIEPKVRWQALIFFAQCCMSFTSAATRFMRRENLQRLDANRDHEPERRQVAGLLAAGVPHD